MHKSLLPILDNACASYTIGNLKIMKQNLVQKSNRSNKDSDRQQQKCGMELRSQRFLRWSHPSTPTEVCSIIWPSILVAPVANTARLPLLIWIIKTPTPPHLARLILQRQDKRTRNGILPSRKDSSEGKMVTPFALLLIFWMKYKILFCTFHFFRTFVLEWPLF